MNDDDVSIITNDITTSGNNFVDFIGAIYMYALIGLGSYLLISFFVFIFYRRHLNKNITKMFNNSNDYMSKRARWLFDKKQYLTNKGIDLKQFSINATYNGKSVYSPNTVDDNSVSDIIGGITIDDIYYPLDENYTGVIDFDINLETKKGIIEKEKTDKKNYLSTLFKVTFLWFVYAPLKTYGCVINYANSTKTKISNSLWNSAKKNIITKQKEEDTTVLKESDDYRKPPKSVKEATGKSLGEHQKDAYNELIEETKEKK